MCGPVLALKSTQSIVSTNSIIFTELSSSITSCSYIIREPFLLHNEEFVLMLHAKNHHPWQNVSEVFFFFNVALLTPLACPCTSSVPLWLMHHSAAPAPFSSQSCQRSLIPHRAMFASLTGAIPLECSPLVIIECSVCICLELV